MRISPVAMTGTALARLIAKFAFGSVTADLGIESVKRCLLHRPQLTM
jgi:hypothetical protein